MTSQQLDEERIFHVARDIPNPETRSEYLVQICAGDHALRERVEALLAVHEKEQSFLKSAENEIASTVEHRTTLERLGSAIGRYKLMEQIGEGGMGTVFVAQQERPIRRKVALKVIKPGMDSRAIVARFEAERQALAMMDHPCIAKVLDAGTTDSGRPYFAMELVKGVPVTEYCDRNRLTISERLRLFIQVCQAIQHAHQKGIIHRDIKPSNILVTLHDGKPVPKVIDFGVAKALNTRLTDKTIYTEHRQIVGTLLYMSPEQAELSGLDIDTRSDIYSLGALLYELLTGATPFQKEELDKAGFDEQRRIIRDKEPPRASVRISSLGETATTVAEHRKTDPKRLQDAVRGDLDWVILKSLEKDRVRRYESASEFANDLVRYLNSEPIEAHPPSAVYRCRKYLNRNKGPAAATFLVLLAVCMGLTAVIISWRKTSKLASELQTTLNALQIQLVDRALMYAMDGQAELAKTTIKDAIRANADPTFEPIVVGEAYLWRGDHDMARRYFGQAVTDAPESYAAKAAFALRASLDPSEHAKATEALNEITPCTPYDHMFGARNELWVSPVRALESLNQARELSDMSFFRVIEMNALSNASFFRPEKGYAAKAVAKAGELHVRQKKGSITLTMDLYSRLAFLHEKRRTAGVLPTHVEQAGEVCDELIPFRDIYFAGRTRAWFLGDYGSVGDAMSEWEHRIGLDPQSTDFIQFAACFYRAERKAEALDLLRASSNTSNVYALISIAQLLADDRANYDEIERICRSIVDRDSSPNICTLAIEVLVLIGRKDAAREIARSAFRSSDVPDLYAAILDFLEGGSANALCDRVIPGNANADTLLWEFNPDYLIGLDQLANGNIEEARERFQRCSETGIFVANWYWWSKAYLENLQRVSS